MFYLSCTMFKMKNIVQCKKCFKENFKRTNGSSAGFHNSENDKISVFCFLSELIDAISALNAYVFPAKLTLNPRSVETFGRELRRISETSGKVVYLCLILIRCIVKSIFYSKRNRWGEIPRFIGKSPPRIFVFSKCPDFPCM